MRNKVTSALTYNRGGQDVASWGFLVDLASNDPDTYDMFKLNLDPAYADPSPYPISVSQARACLRDYLHCVRDYVERTLAESIPHFEEKNVEYIFSTPTTWTSPSMISDIERSLGEAGFGNGPSRRIRMGLTEAEAAAVYATKNNHRKNEVVLVCDAGGGTTDFNFLRIKNAQRRHTNLDQLVPVEGCAIGSALIDWRVSESRLFM